MKPTFQINKVVKQKRKGRYDREKLKALLDSAMEVLRKNEAEAKTLERKLKGIKTPAESKAIRVKIFELRNGILLSKERLEKVIGHKIANVNKFSQLFHEKKYADLVKKYPIYIGSHGNGKENPCVKFELRA